MNDSRLVNAEPKTARYVIEYRIDPDSPLPVASLLGNSGLGLADIVRGMGYANTNKGIRRLHRLLDGDTRRSRELAPLLASALGVSEALVDAAIEDTRYIVWARGDRRRRATFRPHAAWRYERARPSTFIGAGIRTPPLVFEEGTHPSVMLAKALAAAPAGVALLGPTVGIWIHFTPDQRALYDLDGKLITELDDRSERSGA